MDIKEDIIAQIPAWANAKSLKISALKTGHTNKNFLITVDNDMFVLRICTPNAKVLGINRRREYTILKSVNKAGFGPDVLYFDEVEGHMITRYISGQVWSRDIISHPENICRLAKKLKQIHTLPPIEGVYSVFRAMENYIQTIQQYESDFPKDYNKIVKRMYEIEADLLNIRPPLCLCHHDLGVRNIIENSTLYFIDWEYAGMGDPFFDLATLTAYYLNSPKQKEHLLTCYFGEITSYHLEYLKKMEFMALMWGVMWNFLQHHISTIDFNFYQRGEDGLKKLLQIVDE